MIDKADIVIDSKYGNNKYFMYEKKIIVKKDGEEYCIELPKTEKNIGFYDMYYSNNSLNVIVATRDCYDIRYVLDEERLVLLSKQLSK